MKMYYIFVYLFISLGFNLRLPTLGDDAEEFSMSTMVALVVQISTVWDSMALIWVQAPWEENTILSGPKQTLYSYTMLYVNGVIWGNGRK